jgi:hypothetical protein
MGLASDGGLVGAPVAGNLPGTAPRLSSGTAVVAPPGQTFRPPAANFHSQTVPATPAEASQTLVVTGADGTSDPFTPGVGDWFAGWRS